MPSVLPQDEMRATSYPQEVETQLNYRTKLDFLLPPVNHVVVVHLLGCVQLFAIPWTAACQASLPFTIPQNLLKFMSIKSVMLSNHLILCHLLLLLPLTFPSVRVFSNELALHIR